MTLQMLLAASILSWNMPPVYIHLPQVWQKMSGVQKLDFIWSISQYMQQMAALDFPAYGSLYFADLPIDSASKQSFVQGFCIGPHRGTRYWDCNAGEPRYYHRVEPNRGLCELRSISVLDQLAD